MAERYAAIKALTYQGKRYKAGEVLTPTPNATLARQLLDGRFCRHVDTPADVRPAGAGRGRARKPATT